MRTHLETKTKDSFKNLILKLTQNYHISFLIGIFLTLILTSSSALTGIIIAFLSSKLISKKSALAMLLGSNIGTTITPLIFAFNINNYAFVFIAIGMLLLCFKSLFWSHFLASVGVLLFSLLTLQDALLNVSNEISSFISLSPLLSFFQGIFFSMIINSSSSCIITANILYNLSSIKLYQGLAIMLGANVGTTINTLFLLIGMNKDCLQIILINILYNIIGGLFFLAFLDHFETITLYILKSSTKTFIIPLAHLIYNFITTFIVYIFFSFIKTKAHNY